MKALLLLVPLSIAGWVLLQDDEPIAQLNDVDTPYLADIAKKTVVAGKVIPRQEVEIKSKVSGVIEQILVQPGQSVRKGETIALIQPFPNMLYINAIESQLEQAKLNWRTAKTEWDMHKPLYEQRLISASTFERVDHTLKLAETRLQTEKDNLQLLREGTSTRRDKVSNRVVSPIDGVILDITHKEGDHIVEPSAYQAGTSIAIAANMTDLVFEGLVDESDIGKISEGMNMTLSIGALETQSLNKGSANGQSPVNHGDLLLSGHVEFISPKGTEDQGTIKFMVRGSILNPDEIPLKANYSANAYIYLDQRQQVLTINERSLITEGNKYYVEVYGEGQKVERRPIKIGISDGLQVEVVKGLEMGEKLKPVLN